MSKQKTMEAFYQAKLIIGQCQQKRLPLSQTATSAQIVIEQEVAHSKLADAIYEQVGVEQHVLEESIQWYLMSQGKEYQDLRASVEEYYCTLEGAFGGKKSEGEK